MDIADYQRSASVTSRYPLGGPQAPVAPLLGLATKTGSVLGAFNKYLGDGIDLDASRERISEELGDLLWYVAATATACDLDLGEIATANLRHAQDRYGTPLENAPTGPPAVLDSAYPAAERLPRLMVIDFVELYDDRDRLIGRMKLISATPPSPTFRPGRFIGADLTDNTRHADAYRFHDAIHLGFLAVLGWSPNLRALLGLKRKSAPAIDENEDGARAIFAEEGLAAVLSRLAPHRRGFLDEASVDRDAIAVAKAATTDLEVASTPGWLWARAISQGFRAMAELAANGGGYLSADLDARALTYSKVLAGSGSASDDHRTDPRTLER